MILTSAKFECWTSLFRIWIWNENSSWTKKYEYFISQTQPHYVKKAAAHSPILKFDWNEDYKENWITCIHLFQSFKKINILPYYCIIFWIFWTKKLNKKFLFVIHGAPVCLTICIPVHEFSGSCAAGEWDRRPGDTDRSASSGGTAPTGKLLRLHHVLGGLSH